MLISDLVTKARRILGDIEKQRWSDLRLLDIVNDGLRDINNFAGVYRNETYFELMNYQSRYPLPSDLLTVTSLWHNKKLVPMYNREHLTNDFFATKDQVNVGVLELANPPSYVFRDKRFVAGPKNLADSADNLSLSIWTDDTWTGLGLWSSSTLWGQASGQVYTIPMNELEGVVVNPVDELNEFGVTDDLTISIDIYKETPATPYGILTSIFSANLKNIPLKTGGNPFGVATNITIATTPVTEQSGNIGFVNKPFRMVGRYGTIGSLLKPSEYIRVLYKSLPPVVHSLDTAFPLSPNWQGAIVNWLVGSALQDDNDANNNQRSISFINRYQRDLEKGMKDSAVDYSRGSKKYETRYSGGIK